MLLEMDGEDAPAWIMASFFFHYDSTTTTSAPAESCGVFLTFRESR